MSAVRLLLFLLLAPAVLLAQVSDTPPELPPGEEMTPEEVSRYIGRMGEPVADDSDYFSDAEARLWMSDHLENITGPMQLYYEFTKAGALEEGFSDAVYLDILKVNEDGSKDADMEFFTGARKQTFSSENVTNIFGNPILGIYLQGDVYEMSRLTDGSWRHFHRRIKLALHQSAEVQPTTISFSGQELQAEVIRFSPYLNDPHRNRFKRYANKHYEIILSDAVPGTLYQIRTVMENTEENAKPLLTETLTLVSTKSL